MMQQILRSPRTANPPVPGDLGGEELARAGSLVVKLARSSFDIEAAQRLRYEVFALEWSVGVGKAANSDASYARMRRGLDQDVFDAYCEHLVAWDERTGAPVGTYRVLMPERAAALGCLYSDSEFWLESLHNLRPHMIELGRSCIAPSYRKGSVIMLLWSALGELLGRTPHRYLIGCASMGAADGGHQAANLYRELAVKHLAPEDMRVFPRQRLALEQFDTVEGVQAPALIKGYLRAGAKILGEPHLDNEFGCVDFPMFLDLTQLKSRYQERFMGR